MVQNGQAEVVTSITSTSVILHEGYAGVSDWIWGVDRWWIDSRDMCIEY